MAKSKFHPLLLTAGVVLSACADTGELTGEASGVNAYTISIEATKSGSAHDDDSPDTRALGLNGNKLVASWSTSEQVWAYSQYGTLFSGSLRPQRNGSTATLSGEIIGDYVKQGDVIQLQFPRQGAITYDGQKGTLADIAENYDWATASVEVASTKSACSRLWQRM